MHIRGGLICAFALLACSGIGACSRSSENSGQDPHSALGNTIANAMDEARAKLRSGNLDISSAHVAFSSAHDDDYIRGRPRAQISPQGDLLIDGKAVAINAQQRALLLEYRGEVVEVAEAGMAIGAQAADLATHAVGKALQGVFSRKADKDIDREVETETYGIKQAAAKLCARLPAMRDTQQKLAASLTAFAPYATMTQSDIDDCMKDAEHEHVHMGDTSAGSRGLSQ